MADSKVERLMKTPTRELAELEPAEWQETFSDIHADDLRLLSNSLIRLSERAIRMSAYIDARGGENHKDWGHAQAVRAQNDVAEKLRVVLKYQHPRADLEF